MQMPIRRVKVSKYFQQELIEVDSKAIFKYCGAKLTSKKSSSTNSLRNHVVVTRPKISAEDHKRFIAIMKKRPIEGSFVFDP